MKYLLYSLLSFLFISCSNLAYLPCENSAFVQSGDQMMPLNTGNSWTYEMKEIDEDKYIFPAGSRKVEIGDKKKAFYISAQGKKETVDVYTVKADGATSSHIFYLPCAEGAIYSTSYSAKETELINGRTILNNPADGQADPRDKSFKWKNEGIVTVPAGEFKAWSVTFPRDGDTVKEYYAKGVGMIKSEAYNSKGRRYAIMELKEFDIVE